MRELTSCPPNFKIDSNTPQTCILFTCFTARQNWYGYVKNPLTHAINVRTIFSAKVESRGLGGSTEDFRHQLRMVDLKERLGIMEDKSYLRASLDAIVFKCYAIPEPSAPTVNYAGYLKELSEKDPQAFICHFYNIYFAHSAGFKQSQFKPFPTHLYFLLFQVAEKILNGNGLEFYKWDGDLSQLLQNIREKLNKVAETWTRKEKNHCLEETEKSFKYSRDILRLILS
ncbi:hypothetical protein UlMin_008112 [Ulmus minor]